MSTHSRPSTVLAAVSTVKIGENTEMDKTSLPPRCLHAIKKTDSEQDKNTACCVLLISILEKGGLGGAGARGWRN